MSVEPGSAGRRELGKDKLVENTLNWEGPLWGRTGNFSPANRIDRSRWSLRFHCGGQSRIGRTCTDQRYTVVGCDCDMPDCLTGTAEFRFIGFSLPFTVFPEWALGRVTVRPMNCWHRFDFSADPSGNSLHDRRNESLSSGHGSWLPIRRDW